MTDVIYQTPSALVLPSAGVESSAPSLVSAEWQATVDGLDEMELTRMLILARASRSTAGRRATVVPARDSH